MRNQIFGTLLLLALIFTGCATQSPSLLPPKRLSPLTGKAIPEIRIGISQNTQSCEFVVNQPASVTTPQGDELFFCPAGSEWQIAANTGVQYYLVAGSMSSEQSAENKMSELNTMGFRCFSVPVPADSGQTRYRIYLDREFQTELQAREFKQSLINTLETFLDTQPDSKGPRLIISNLKTGESYDCYDAIQVRNSNVTLRQILVGQGYHWEKKENREYPEIIEFKMNENRQLQIINIVNLETYLMGVVPSEMPFGFPLEALKAQAIAARSEAYAKLGNTHFEDDFDLCADVHCQVYSGLSRRTPQTDRAVYETTGMVLWHDGHVCDAVYSSVCGGHTEHNEYAWTGSGKEYLRGTYDGSSRLKKFGDLRRDNHLEKWIDDSPDAYCNTQKGDFPTSMNYTKKYFRWEVPINQLELQQTLLQKGGWDVGGILGLIPTRRGVSGRIIELKVVGEKGEFSINGELRIRKALSPNTLWSACFYVKKQGWENGLPQTFILKGAGFGHGVGMCQTGAGVMALEGKSYDKILKHYYNKVQIKRMY